MACAEYSAVTPSAWTKILSISDHRSDYPFRRHAILIFGALGATLLGGLSALQFDRLIAVGQWAMHPVGQESLLQTTATASLTGLLCWVICALVTRAIRRFALRPYDALADHLERLADSEVDGFDDWRAPVAGVRRLARAVMVFQQRTLTSQRSEAGLQSRYDSLYREHAEERRLLMGMLMSKRLNPDEDGTALLASGGPEPDEFDIPERPAAAIGSPSGRSSHVGQVVDLTGRLISPARRIDDGRSDGMDFPDFMPLDFAFVRR